MRVFDLVLFCGEQDQLAQLVRAALTGKIQGDEQIARDVEQTGRQAVVLHLDQLLQMGMAVRERIRAIDQQLMIQPALVAVQAFVPHERRLQEIIRTGMSAVKQGVRADVQRGDEVCDL